MPPKVRFTRENVLEAAFALVRESGMEALNARSLAERAGSSTQPLFRVFSGMDEIKEQVIKMARKRFDEFVRAVQNEDMPVYKRTGMACMRFARDEKQLYRLLFMTKRAEQDQLAVEQHTMDYVYNAGMASTGLGEAEIERFHIHMWIYVHGLATMIATGYLDMGDDIASKLISECYHGLLKQFEAEKKNT